MKNRLWSTGITLIITASLVASGVGQVTEEWTAIYNGPGNGADFPHAMTIDAKGHIYVTGASWGQETSFDYATIKYDSSGKPLWVARYEGPANDMDVATSIAVDAQGYVYVTGKSAGTDTNLDYATIKYDPAGKPLWVARYNGSENNEDIAMAIAVDAKGNVYVTGEALEKDTDFDIVTIKYDANGKQLWIAKYNGPANSVDEVRALALDAEGSVYVTGMGVGIDTVSDVITRAQRL